MLAVLVPNIWYLGFNNPKIFNAWFQGVEKRCTNCGPLIQGVFQRWVKKYIWKKNLFPLERCKRMDKRLLFGETHVPEVQQFTFKKINNSAYEQGNVEILLGILIKSLRLSEVPCELIDFYLRGMQIISVWWKINPQDLLFSTLS